MNLLHIMAGGLGGGGEFFTYEAAQKVNLLDNSITVSPYYLNKSSGTPTITYSYIDDDEVLLSKKILRAERINITSTAAITLTNEFRISNISSLADGANIRAGALLKKCSTTFNGLVSLAIAYYTSNFTYISGTTKANITLTDAWVQHYVSTTKPTNAVYAAISVGTSSALTNMDIGFSAPFIIAGTSVDYEVYVNQSDLDNKKYFYNKKIAILGDSITQHNTVKFPTITFYKRGFKDYRNYGISGAYLTPLGATNVESEYETLLASGYSPNIIIIEMITNDLLYLPVVGSVNSFNKNEIYGAYNNIINRINTDFPGCKVALCSATQRGDTATDYQYQFYRDAVEYFCTQKNIAFIDNYNCGILRENEMSPGPYQYTKDGLHPTQEGGFLIGEYAAAQILSKRAYL